MASGDPPKRRAEPLAASDSATDVDEATDPRARRPTDVMDATRERQKRARRQQRAHTAEVSDEDEPGESTAVSPMPEDRRDEGRRERGARPRSKPRAERPQQRSTEIYMDDPDVVGAPERTVIAPLPPQDEPAEPVPLPHTPTVTDDERPRRSRDAARPRGDERSQPQRQRDDERDSVRTARPNRDAALLRQNTKVERVPDDTPGRRLVVAIRDLWRASVSAIKYYWKILSTQGPGPFIDAARPTVERAWLYVRHVAIKAKIVAVKGAVRVGLVKPRRLEYELEASDRVDRERAAAWRRFHDGRKSSSYLQDDE